MNKQIKFILTLLGIAVFFVGASFLYQFLSDHYDPQNITVTEEQGTVETDAEESQAETDAEEASGESSEQALPAPDFTVYTEDGTAVQLTDFRGKPVVLNFWASWCPPCKGEMPDFEAVYKERGEEIHFVMINLTDGDRETVETGSAYVQSQGYTFPVYYDSDLIAANNYQVYSVPMTYFLDADGYAVARASGAIDAETLERGISMITE